MPSANSVASWTIGMPRLAAIRAATSRPIGLADARITPLHTELIAEAHAPPSNVEKQSPTTEITFSTPAIVAASAAPMPPGQMTVEPLPRDDAAPTS